MLASAGMLSLSVNYPRRVVTNEDIRSRAPTGRRGERSARPWPGSGRASARAPRSWGIWARRWSRTSVTRSAATVERRHLAPGESSLSLELVAAREAIARCGLEPRDIDLVIGTSFLPDQIGVGNATFVCKHLGLRAAAWNLESACSGSLVAFQTACALVQAGKFRKILVVTSCAYSRYSDPEDTAGWFLGDGGAAFVVGEVPAGEGLLAQASRHTGEFCGAFSYDLGVGPAGSPQIVMHADASAGRLLAEYQDGYVLSMTQEALTRAGLALDDIRLFAFNTPTAWFHRYFAALLGIDLERTITTFPFLANIGPVLIPASLHFAAASGRLARGDLVLLFSVGSIASTAAAIVKWGDIAIGTNPLAGLAGSP
jgi:3-oxoacyl-[acyl-carrier-protein] synthase-3